MLEITWTAVTANSIKNFLSNCAAPGTLSGRRIINNRREGLNLEACAADQRPIDIRLGHQAFNIVGLDASPVKDPHTLRMVFAKPSTRQSTQIRMAFLCLLRSSGAAGTNSPDGLISHNDTGKLRGGQPGETALELAFEHLLRLVIFALIQRLTNADNRSQPRSERRF